MEDLHSPGQALIYWERNFIIKPNGTLNKIHTKVLLKKHYEF